MRNPLKRLALRDTQKLTMRERAAMLKASAARVIRRRPAIQPTDQPSGETLLANTVLDRGDDGFPGAKHLPHEHREGTAQPTNRDDAGKNGASRSETDMGRHETFDTAIPLADSLLSGTSIGKTLPAPREAILAHRAARQALHDVCDATDELAIQRAGGDTSDEAMAPARAEWERRNDSELDAWNELLSARPSDHAELIEQIRYIAASPALGDFQHPEVVLENIAQSVEALADPFEGRPTPAGFVPYPFDAPSAWLNIRSALKEEGERLLRIALGELDRRMGAYRASRFDEDEVRSHETRLRRELRIDALMALSGRMDPSDKPLPEPGSEAAMAAFHAACGEATRLMDSPLNGYPELRHPKTGWWTKHCLNRALDDGTITPVEFARLHPLAAEREYRNEAALLATNLGALFALAYADEYPHVPAEEDANLIEVEGSADAASDPARAAIEAHRAAYAEWDPLSRIYMDLSPGSPEHVAARAEAEGPGKREAAAFKTLLSTKATTVDGLRLLIEYLPQATRQVSIDNGDGDEQRALDLIRASFLGLEDSQRLISEPRHVVKLPPVADLLSKAILKEWAAYAALPDDGTSESDAAIDRAIKRRFDLIEAAERLPAIETSLTAKALALAWLDYVEHWRKGQRRDEYGIDGRLALDIHAIASGHEPRDAAPEQAILAAMAASQAVGVEKPAGAAANSRLVALVDEWTRLGIQLNDPGIGDELVGEISDKHTAVQIEIGLFPCRSLVDLCAKIPVFRDEMADAAAGLAEGRVEETLAGSVWTGLIRDIQLLNGTAPEQQVEPDPIHAAIAASRAAETAMAEWQARTSALPGAMTEALFAEEEALCEIQSRTRDVALSTVPTTRAGRLALVEYVRFVMGLFGMGLFGMGEDGEGIDNLHIWKQTQATLMAALVMPVASPEADAGVEGA